MIAASAPATLYLNMQRLTLDVSIGKRRGFFSTSLKGCNSSRQHRLPIAKCRCNRLFLPSCDCSDRTAT